MTHFFATLSWVLTVLYWPGEVTQTYDPSLQEPNICLEQIRSESTWPIARMSIDISSNVKRPVFVGCFYQSFQDEYNLFEKAVIDQPPTNKWYIVRLADDNGLSEQGPYVLEDCLADFYELHTGGNTIMAGCINESAFKVLSGSVYSRFIYNQHHKETK